MYKVFLDGYLIHDPSLNDPSVMVIGDPVIVQEENLASSFTFTLEPTHTSYNNVRMLSSIIEVYEDNTPVFRGRPFEETISWNNSKKILCEGMLGFLNDTIVRPYSFNGSVMEYLSFLIDQHNNEMVSYPERQFTLRNVTVTDPNDYITRANSNYPNTFSEITEKCVKLLGGYLIPSYENETLYLDYLADSPYQSTQAVEFGENLLDIIQKNQGGDIATVLIPLGTKTVDEETGEESRLTIESVNDGKDYIVNETAVALYGLISAMETWDDVTTASALLQKGTARLAELSLGLNSIELTAVDLNLIDKTVDDFRFMEYVQVTSPPHGIDTRMLVRKMTVYLETPQSNKLQLGTESLGLSKITSSATERVEKIESDYVVNERIGAIINDIHETSSMITQMSDNIMSQVNELYVRQSDYGSDITQLQTQIEQTASDITFTFSSLMAQINQVNGDTQSQFQEQQKYIRFVDGKIVIGVEGDPLTVQIANDRMSFLQNGMEVAYVSNSMLYITDAEIITSLRLGNFAFFPRANGNLSFRRTR